MGSEGRMKDEMGCKAPESPRRCANRCGFFGTAATRGLCSKCYRDFCIKLGQPSSIMASVEKSEHNLSPSLTTSVTSTTTKQQQKQPQQLSVPDQSSSGGPVDVNPTVAGAVESSPVVKNRCVSCRKKVGLLGFKCRCGSTFCSVHRYPEKHSCTFNYKAVGQDAIANANPLVKSDKIDRF